MPLHPRVVRAEVEDVLRSGRLHRLVSVQAQVFHLIDSKWVELTSEPILVHLIHDQLEGVAKMLAVWRLKLVINNVPVSSNFNIHTPSKKFLQFICNKFDKNSDIYGFGFADSIEMDLFNQQLIRIRSAAMASLTPSFHLGSNSLPQTPTRPHRRVLFPRASYEGSSAAPTNSISPPFGYMGSPMRNILSNSDSTSSFQLEETVSKEEPASFFGDSLNTTSSRLNSCQGLYEDSGCTYSNTSQITDSLQTNSFFDNRPYCESTPLASPKPGLGFNNVEKMSDLFSQFKLNEPNNNNVEEDAGCSVAERRLRDFITSFDISTPTFTDLTYNLFNTDDIPTNSAGAIGTPVKGKGGVVNFNSEADVEVK